MTIPTNANLSFFAEDIKDAITGAPIPNAEFLITAQNNTEAVIYSVDNLGVESIIAGSTVRSDNLGRLVFYAEPGFYQLKLSGTSEQITIIVPEISSTGGGGGGITEVASDATLQGTGAPGSPLGIASSGVTASRLARFSVSTNKLSGEVRAFLHKHANLAILNGLGINAAGTKLTLNGNEVDTTIAQRDVINNLLSQDTAVSLSAAQGKILKELIDSLQATVDAIPSGGGGTDNSDVANANAAKTADITLAPRIWTGVVSTAFTLASSESARTNAEIEALTYTNEIESFGGSRRVYFRVGVFVTSIHELRIVDRNDDYIYVYSHLVESFRNSQYKYYHIGFSADSFSLVTLRSGHTLSIQHSSSGQGFTTFHGIVVKQQVLAALGALTQDEKLALEIYGNLEIGRRSLIAPKRNLYVLDPTDFKIYEAQSIPGSGALVWVELFNLNNSEETKESILTKLATLSPEELTTLGIGTGGGGGIGVSEFIELPRINNGYVLPDNFLMAQAVSVTDQRGDHVEIMLTPLDIPASGGTNRSGSAGRSGAFTIRIGSDRRVSQQAPLAIARVSYITKTAGSGTDTGSPSGASQAAIRANTQLAHANQTAISTLQNAVHRIATTSELSPVLRNTLETLQSYFTTTTDKARFIDLFRGDAYNQPGDAWQADGIENGEQVEADGTAIAKANTYTPIAGSPLQDPATRGGRLYPMRYRGGDGKPTVTWVTYGDPGATFLTAGSEVTAQPQPILRMGNLTIIQATARGLNIISGVGAGVARRPTTATGYLNLHGTALTEYTFNGGNISSPEPATVNFDFPANARQGRVTIEFILATASASGSQIVRQQLTIPRRTSGVDLANFNLELGGNNFTGTVRYIPNDAALNDANIIEVTIAGATSAVHVRVSAQITATPLDPNSGEAARNQHYALHATPLPSAVGFNGFVAEFDTTDSASDSLKLTVAGGAIITQDLGFKLSLTQLNAPQILYAGFNGWVTDIVGLTSVAPHVISDRELVLYSRDLYFHGHSPFLVAANTHTDFQIPNVEPAWREADLADLDIQNQGTANQVQFRVPTGWRNMRVEYTVTQGFLTVNHTDIYYNLMDEIPLRIFVEGFTTQFNVPIRIDRTRLVLMPLRATITAVFYQPLENS